MQLENSERPDLLYELIALSLFPNQIPFSIFQTSHTRRRRDSYYIPFTPSARESQKATGLHHLFCPALNLRLPPRSSLQHLSLLHPRNWVLHIRLLLQIKRLVSLSFVFFMRGSRGLKWKTYASDIVCSRLGRLVRPIDPSLLREMLWRLSQARRRVLLRWV